MLKHRLLFALFLVATHSDAQTTDEARRFDVPGGMLQTLFVHELEANTRIECRIRIESTESDRTWSPSFHIVLSEEMDISGESPTNQFVRVGLSFNGADFSRAYKHLTLRGDEMTVRPAFLGLKGDYETVILSLGYRGDGVFHYYASEDDADYGQGDLHEAGIEPKYAIAVMSGMDANVSCEPKWF
jgi:hypothetical protein